MELPRMLGRIQNWKGEANLLLILCVSTEQLQQSLLFLLGVSLASGQSYP